MIETIIIGVVLTIIFMIVFGFSVGLFSGPLSIFRKPPRQ
jgi:hypothetical protein